MKIGENANPVAKSLPILRTSGTFTIKLEAFVQEKYSLELVSEVIVRPTLTY